MSTRYFRDCLACGQHKQHQCRGLCAACVDRMKRTGRLEDFPRLTWARDELLEEWGHLRRAGVNLTEAARRIGVSRYALEKAVQRAKRAA